MAITDILFPQGNFLNIRANAPSQTDYNIQATSDLVNQLPGGIVRDVVAPAAALGMSLPYDAIQGASRITEDDMMRAMETAGMYGPKDIAAEAFGLSYGRERPLSSAIERFIGASQPLANRLSNTGTAQAEPMDAENYLGTSVPTEVAIKAAPQVFNPQADYGQFFRPQPVVDRNLFTPITEKVSSLRQGISSLKDKGIDLGRTALSGIISAATGIPGIGFLANALPERDYRQTALEDFYGNVQNGTIQSGLMAGYNPVSGGLLNMLTGGKYGEETKYGLSDAIDRRIATIKKTLEKKKSVQLEQRLKALEELKQREAAALQAARDKAAAELESKRIGRRPSAPSGGGGVKDSGGPTGGYSYDSGGRQGFGYGLKNGGIVDLL